MVFTCFMCKQRSDKAHELSFPLSFHRFPSNNDSKQKWLNAIGKPNATPGKRTTICSQHFTDDCYRFGLVYGNRRLKEGSKPSLRLGRSDERYKDIVAIKSEVADEPAPILSEAVAIPPKQTFTDAPSLQLSDETTSMLSEAFVPPLKHAATSCSSSDEQGEDINSIKFELSNESHTFATPPKQTTTDASSRVDNNNLKMSEQLLWDAVPGTKIDFDDLTWEEFSASPTRSKMYWEEAKKELQLREKKLLLSENELLLSENKLYLCETKLDVCGKKIVCLRQKVRRMTRRISSLKSLTRHLPKEKLSVGDKVRVLHMSNVDVTTNNQIR